MMRRFVVGGLTVALLAGVHAPAESYPRPGRTMLVSPSVTGGATDTAISSNGRFVAFASEATDVVPGDDNDRPDIFVTDIETGVTERVSVGVGGGDANGQSTSPSISADGRFVAFQSRATNLVFGDTNMWEEVFVRDRLTNTTERVSVGIGAQADRDSHSPHISANGRYVAFVSAAQNLVPGDTNPDGIDDAFVYDRAADTTELVSVSSAEQQPSGLTGAGGPVVSADGRFVAFESTAATLVPDDLNQVSDVFLRDRELGTTTRISVSTQSGEGSGSSTEPSISEDGRFVAFASIASNLVPRDTNGLRDAFVRDTLRGRTERVSVSSTGTAHDLGMPAETIPVLSPDWRLAPAISPDGRYVAFVTTAPNLVSGDSDTAGDVFLHDRLAGSTEWISISDGAGGASFAGAASVSSDGRVVAFMDGDPLVSEDLDQHADAYIRHRGPSSGVGEIAATLQGSILTISGWVGLSGRSISSAPDPGGDATAGAREAGGDLVGAALAYRPEQEDLFVRIELAALPTVRAPGPGSPLNPPGQLTHMMPSETGSPLLHGLAFVLDGVRYEVRAIRTNFEETPTEALISLWRCPSSCTEIAHLQGGYGTRGEEIVASIPLRVGSDFRADEGDSITSIRGYAALGEPFAGPQLVLDDVDLKEGSVPEASIFLALAPEGTPEAEVSFQDFGPPAHGRFEATVSAAGFPPGRYDLWGRGCMASACGTRSIPVTLP